MGLVFGFQFEFLGSAMNQVDLTVFQHWLSPSGAISINLTHKKIFFYCYALKTLVFVINVKPLVNWSKGKWAV